MRTLNSILTLSKSFDYGELIRQNYENRPVDTYYLPFFDKATSLIQVTHPDAIVLNLRSQDFGECSAFLQQLLILQQETPNYAPTVFISTITSATIQQMLPPPQKLYFLQAGTLKQEEFMTLEAISPAILIELFNASLVEQSALESIYSTTNPFEPMVPVLVC